MPLIIMTGLPSSGKSKRAQELKDHILLKNIDVFLISEDEIIIRTGFDKNSYFSDSKHEKMGRANLKSEVVKHLSKDNVVILDAGNYIKGYRYELYCASKEHRTTKVTIHCAISKEQAWEFNTSRSGQQNELDANAVGYSREIFDALCLRYEEPNSMSRWDSPLITLFPDDELDFANIYSQLFDKKPPPPNQSTQSVSSLS